MVPAHVLSLPVQRSNRWYLYVHLPSTFIISSNPHSNSLKLVGQIQSSFFYNWGNQSSQKLVWLVWGHSLWGRSQNKLLSSGFSLCSLPWSVAADSSRTNSFVKRQVRVTLSPQPYSPLDSYLALRERCPPGDKYRCPGGPPWSRLRETGPTCCHPSRGPLMTQV